MKEKKRWNCLKRNYFPCRFSTKNVIRKFLLLFFLLLLKMPQSSFFFVDNECEFFQLLSCVCVCVCWCTVEGSLHFSGNKYHEQLVSEENFAFFVVLIFFKDFSLGFCFLFLFFWYFLFMILSTVLNTPSCSRIIFCCCSFSLLYTFANWFFCHPFPQSLFWSFFSYFFAFGSCRRFVSSSGRKLWLKWMELYIFLNLDVW